MAGHMGNRRATVLNLTVVDVIPERNLLLVRAVFPGPKTASSWCAAPSRAREPVGGSNARD